MAGGNRKRNAGWIIGLSMLVGLVFYVGWVKSSRVPASVVVEQPLWLTFADGGELEIAGVSVGERVILFPRPPWFLRWYDSFSFFGSSLPLKVKFKTENGQVVRCTATSSLSSPNALLMEISLRAPNGMPVDLPRHLFFRNWVSGDDVFSNRAELKHPGESLKEWREALADVDMQLLIQHRDPQAGWIHLWGPFPLASEITLKSYSLNNSFGDRYIVVLPAWQRDLPTLDFRAIRADGSIVEFSLPNPDLKPAAPATFAAAPLTHSAADYSLTLTEVTRDFQPGAHPFCGFDLQLVPVGAGLNSDSALSIQAWSSEVMDDFGNQLGLEREALQGKEVAGARLPAGAKRASLLVKVERGPAYPRAASDGYTVLEGVVRADGSAVDFTLTPDAAHFGILVPPAGKILPITHGNEATKDWKMLDFEIAGEIVPAESGPIQSRIGGPHHWEYLVFPENTANSASIPQILRGGRGGSSRRLFERLNRWRGPPAAFLPGARLRIGVHRELADDEVKFEVELPGK